MTKKVLSTFDAARLLGLSPYTIRLWIEKGLLPAYRTPGGHRRIRAEELDAFLKKHRMPVPGNEGPGGPALLYLGGGKSDYDLRRVRRFLPKFAVRAASCSIEAGFLLLRDRPALVVLDMDLGRARVSEVAALVRKHPEVSGVQMLGIAARVTADMVVSARRSGFYDVLSKPVSRNELEKAVEAMFASSSFVSKV